MTEVIILLSTYIYSEVERIIKKYGTRDPYKLLDAIGAITIFSDEYPCDGLKGYSSIMNRVMYAVINNKLCSEEKRIVAGHEASHLIIHKDEIMTSPVRMMKDFNIFDNSGQHEREANTFLADFLVSDKDVLETVMDRGIDYFGAARELYLPPHLFAFKLYNMMQRGHKVRSPVALNSQFLGKDTGRW